MIDVETSEPINPPRLGFVHSWTLDEVEAFLTGRR